MYTIQRSRWKWNKEEEEKETKERNGCSLNETFSFYCLSLSLSLTSHTHIRYPIVECLSYLHIYFCSFVLQTLRKLYTLTECTSQRVRAETKKKIEKESDREGRICSKSIVNVFSSWVTHVLCGSKWFSCCVCARANACKVHTHTHISERIIKFNWKSVFCGNTSNYWIEFGSSLSHRKGIIIIVC